MVDCFGAERRLYVLGACYAPGNSKAKSTRRRIYNGLMRAGQETAIGLRVPAKCDQLSHLSAR
jgi:hypothetical protein